MISTLTRRWMVFPLVCCWFYNRLLSPTGEVSSALWFIFFYFPFLLSFILIFPLFIDHRLYDLGLLSTWNSPDNSLLPPPIYGTIDRDEMNSGAIYCSLPCSCLFHLGFFRLVISEPSSISSSLRLSVKVTVFPMDSFPLLPKNQVASTTHTHHSKITAEGDSRNRDVSFQLFLKLCQEEILGYVDVCVCMGGGLL